MQRIPLSKGQFALVSDEDHAYLLSVGSWCFSNSAYAVHYHRTEDGFRQTWSMHRVVMARMLGRPIPEGMTVDHIDKNRIHNTRANLRLANHMQQQANRAYAHTSSGYKGVTEDGRKFRARIRYDRGKSLSLGSYDDPAFAAMLYDAAALLLFEDFSSLNFPDIPTPPEVETLLQARLLRSPETLKFLRRGGRSVT